MSPAHRDLRGPEGSRALDMEPGGPSTSEPALSVTVETPESRAAPEAYPEAPSATSRADPSLQGLKILVIDDELDARLLMTEILSGKGAQVRTSASAAEGRALFLEWKPDLLISDLAMPEESGIALIQSIRSSGPEGASVPAIALTGLSDRVGALTSGYDLFVAKPVKPSELLLLIANISGQLPRAPGSSSGAPQGP